MLHVRIASPLDVTGRLAETLSADSGVLHLVVLKGGGPAVLFGVAIRWSGHGRPAGAAPDLAHGSGVMTRALVHLPAPCDLVINVASRPSVRLTRDG